MDNMKHDQIYKIDKNIPFGKPKKKKVTESKYPFKRMMSGDSFFVEADKKQIQALRMSLHFYKKTTNTKYIYKTRKTEKGVRVWCFMREPK
jgi:hypothetical protein